MPTTIPITVVPLGCRGRYRAYVGARLLVAPTRMPWLDAARELIQFHADFDVPIVMRHEGASHDALRARLGTAAKLAVDEDRCRFRSVRRGDTAPRVRQKPLAYAGGLASADGRAA
jgi:hypothetical protein